MSGHASTPVGGEPVALDARTPARERLAADVLGWGNARPVAPPDLVDRLAAMIEAGLGAMHEQLAAMAAVRARRTVLLTKTGLGRLVCDGWQLEPRRSEPTTASVRGTLAHHAIAGDLTGMRGMAASELVERTWYEAASRRPGDPASLSAWLNARSSVESDTLRREVADLVEAFREVWPPLPSTAVVSRVASPMEVRLAGGLVTLRGIPDLVLDSPRQDDHARALVVDLKTGQPRSESDRHELRFSALLTTLATGRPPFRWATFYVTEGRSEAEDLATASLEAAANRVLDGARQLVRIWEQAGSTEGLRLDAGEWCGSCLRVNHCDVAAAARGSHQPR